ncbi:MAG: winged helix-turn-helix domain-containing protein [Mariprofundaceae bacterium]
MNVQDAVIQILKDAGKPLHAKEIAERIIEAGLWSSDGKIPETTVSARLYSDIKKHREVTVKKYLTVRQEGNREAKCHFNYYIPDLIGGRSSLCGPGCTKVGGQANG